MKEKRPLKSKIIYRELIMPAQINNKNTLFGGELFSLIDKAASMSAQKHAGCSVVTASIDHLSFESPVYNGENLILKAMTNYVGNTSMEIGVRVEVENPYDNKKRHIATAYLTFVAVDDELNPRKIPKIKAITKEEKRRFKNAKERVKYRKKYFIKN